MVEDRLARIMRRFDEFANAYPDLPLYAAVSRHASTDPDVASLLLAARPGQARPVLLLAALHHLVLREPDLPVARWYASVVGRDQVATGDPWPDVRAVMLDQRQALTDLIATRDTQTNEVNRVIYLAALLRLACADLPEQPVALLELGCSAGLQLGVDRYLLSLTRGAHRQDIGPTGSAVHCVGEDRSDQPLRFALPRIDARLGIDRTPVPLDDDARLRWLEACLWPDVPGRFERFVAAVDTLRADPPAVIAGDMVQALPAAVARLRKAAPGAHLVVYTSWALTYVPEDGRSAIAASLADSATAGPVSLITAEHDGCVPQVPRSGLPPAATVLAGRRWRAGAELPPTAWGTAHPHGGWIRIHLTAADAASPSRAH